MKTQVKQGKGIADHSMPLRDWLLDSLQLKTFKYLGKGKTKGAPTPTEKKSENHFPIQAGKMNNCSPILWVQQDGEPQNIVSTY